MEPIKRQIEKEIKAAADAQPVVILSGPTDCGKTILARELFPAKPYENLEDDEIFRFVEKDARKFLSGYARGAVINEVQRQEKLVAELSGIVSETEFDGKFILTASEDIDLTALSGKVVQLRVSPFSIRELRGIALPGTLNEVLYYGFYPNIYKFNREPSRYHQGYLQAIMEREVSNRINGDSVDKFYELMKLLAERIGAVLDLSYLSSQLEISEKIVEQWIAVLKKLFLVTEIYPYSSDPKNNKNAVPQLYFSDVGTASHLLGIESRSEVSSHTLRGQLFHNLVINELQKACWNRAANHTLYFDPDSDPVAGDLILVKGEEIIAISTKTADTVHQGFLKGLHRFSDSHPKDNISRILIYSGPHDEPIDDARAINYRHIDELF